MLLKCEGYADAKLKVKLGRAFLKYFKRKNMGAYTFKKTKTA